MAKKIMAMLLVLACILFTAWAAAYVKKSGLFRPYPDKEYLTAQEEALRPVYSQLSDDEKALYTAVYRGVNDYEAEIPLPYDAEGASYSRIYCLIEKQEGGLFWLDSTYYTAERLRDATIVYRTEDSAERERMISELEEAAQTALEGVPEGADEFELAEYIHDYIIENCSYTTNGLSLFGATAYGCLVDGKAHCEGYAKAFQYLCAQAGLECVVITGVTDDGENHAWNQVNIDDKWYNVDVTWDDLDAEIEGRRLYFLCDDEFMSESHTAEIAYFMPFECVSADNWFVRRDMLIDDMEDAERVVTREVLDGEKVLELKFGSIEMYESFVNEYLEGEMLFDILMESGMTTPEKGVTVTLRENAEELCMTVEIK